MVAAAKVLLEVLDSKRKTTEAVVRHTDCQGRMSDSGRDKPSFARNLASLRLTSDNLVVAASHEFFGPIRVIAVACCTTYREAPILVYSDADAFECVVKAQSFRGHPLLTQAFVSCF